MEPSQEKELGVASEPPVDVVIPVDTFYGPNTAVEPPEATPVVDNPNPIPEAAATATISSAGKQTKGNWIEIPIGAFAFLGMVLLGGSFFMGTQMGTTKTVVSQQGGSSEQPPSDKPKNVVNMIPDRGLYVRQSQNTWSTVQKRLPLAKQQILVITHNPNHPILLSYLREYKNNTGIPINIMTGSDTDLTQMREATAKSGLPVYQLKGELERPYTIILIDNKAVLDASRENWYWESTDSRIIENITKWAAQTIEGATLR